MALGDCCRPGTRAKEEIKVCLAVVRFWTNKGLSSQMLQVSPWLWFLVQRDLVDIRP